MSFLQGKGLVWFEGITWHEEIDWKPQDNEDKKRVENWQSKVFKFSTSSLTTIISHNWMWFLPRVGVCK